MNGFLLDTNIALIALSEPDFLKPDIAIAIVRGPNYLSTVVYWEVMLKSMKGKLQVGDPRTWWQGALEQLAAVALPLRAEHIATLYRLPPIHQDPFDRVLIVQAMTKDLALVTTDAEISKYASEHFKSFGSYERPCNPGV